MLAKITCPKSITRALNYNEQKVQKGKPNALMQVTFYWMPEK
jgi:hypothetical protein